MAYLDSVSFISIFLPVHDVELRQKIKRKVAMPKSPDKELSEWVNKDLISLFHKQSMLEENLAELKAQLREFSTSEKCTFFTFFEAIDQEKTHFVNAENLVKFLEQYDKSEEVKDHIDFFITRFDKSGKKQLSYFDFLSALFPPGKSRVTVSSIVSSAMTHIKVTSLGLQEGIIQEENERESEVVESKFAHEDEKQTTEYKTPGQTKHETIDTPESLVNLDKEPVDQKTPHVKAETSTYLNRSQCPVRRKLDLDETGTDTILLKSGLKEEEKMAQVKNLFEVQLKSCKRIEQLKSELYERPDFSVSTAMTYFEPISEGGLNMVQLEKALSKLGLVKPNVTRIFKRYASNIETFTNKDLEALLLPQSGPVKTRSLVVMVMVKNEYV